MNHHDVEQELQHLEYIFARLSAKDAIPPLTYWRGRIDSLRKLPIVPSQRERINRLEQLLGALELAMTQRTKDTAGTKRTTGEKSTPNETLARTVPRPRR